MAFKQNYTNFREYIDPIWQLKPKIDAIKEEFAETLAKYEPDSKTPIEEVKCEKTDEYSIRRFQALRDYALSDEKANIIGEYMELIKQFGFIVLFSEIFPPAALFSFVCNFIQMKSQINNFQYSRRFRAEVGNGIGAFMDCIDILVRISIMSNCALLFWTSRYFAEIFVSVGLEDRQKNVTPITEGWTYIDFLKVIIYVEHAMILFQIFLRQVVDEKPAFVIAGERDRDTLLGTYIKHRDSCHHTNIKDAERLLMEEGFGSALDSVAQDDSKDQQAKLREDFHQRIVGIQDHTRKILETRVEGMKKLNAQAHG